MGPRFVVPFLSTASLLIFFAPLVASTEVCMTCRPVELQIAPGVGIDLTMAYASVAIQYRNGTVYDIVKMDGTPEYLLAMKALAKDARNVRNGEPSSLVTPIYLPPKHTWWPLSSIFKEYKNIYSILSQPPLLSSRAPKPNSWTNGIAAMLTQVKAVLDTTVPPLPYNFVILSWPDFEADTGHIYKDGFKVACQLAGLEEFQSHSQIASRLALRHYGIEDESGNLNGELVQGTQPGTKNGDFNVILSITYTRESLGVTLLTKWAGMIWPSRLSENEDYGSDAPLLRQDPKRYWSGAKGHIEAALGTNQIDQLIILGSDAHNPQLLKAIKEIFEQYSYDDIILQREIGRPGCTSQSLYAAARGAAAVARLGMQTGFDACIVPDNCPRTEDLEDVDGRKSEL